MRCDHFIFTTRFHPTAEIMISNSRPVTQHISFGSESPRPNSRATETYSDTLMDDLFGDVDRILEGDLSACMTVVKPNRRAATPNPSTRTVQLPSNFAPQSATDIYQATMAAANQQSQAQQQAAHARAIAQSVANSTLNSSSTSRSAQHRRPTGYSNGGRPVTTLPSNIARSGNFKSAVIQSPLGTTTVEMHSAQSVGQNAQTYLYPQNTLAQSSLTPESLTELTLTNASPRPPQTIFEPKAQQQPVSLPFLLMGAAGISVASTFGLWAVGQSAPGGNWLMLSTEASAAELPNSDEDFLAYLQHALDNISATQASNAQTVAAVIPVTAPGNTLPTTVPNVNAAPTAGVLPNLPGAANTTNVIERVFVPVYENNTQAVAAAPAAPLPQVAVPASAPRPTVPVPAPVAAAAAIPAGAPAAASPSVPIVPGSAALPTPSAPPTTVAVAPTNSGATGLTDVTPDSALALVGVLNLGSRSAALFDIDGTSQRAYVGDRIGLSGWTLVSVNGQDVVIRRDGEVRSVYIGQRF